MVGVPDLSSPAPVIVSAPTVTTRAATTESIILIIGLPLSVVEPGPCIIVCLAFAVIAVTNCSILLTPDFARVCRQPNRQTAALPLNVCRLQPFFTAPNQPSGHRRPTRTATLSAARRIALEMFFQWCRLRQ